MNDNTAKWFLLPGMGADCSMYDLLRQELDFDINVINWPEGGNPVFSMLCGSPGQAGG